MPGGAWAGCCHTGVAAVWHVWKFMQGKGVLLGLGFVWGAKHAVEGLVGFQVLKS